MGEGELVRLALHRLEAASLFLQQACELLHEADHHRDECERLTAAMNALLLALRMDAMKAARRERAD